MKRDMDLVRTILQRMEEHSDPTEHIDTHFAGHGEIEINYHLQIMTEAGLIDALVAEEASGETYCVPLRLTWEGHEFLDAARDEKVWKKVAVKAASVPLEVLKALLIEEMKRQLGLSGS